MEVQLTLALKVAQNKLSAMKDWHSLQIAWDLYKQWTISAQTRMPCQRKNDPVFSLDSGSGDTPLEALQAFVKRIEISLVLSEQEQQAKACKRKRRKK